MQKPLIDKTWKMQTASLMTRWAKDVKIDCPLPEYPRPQLVREAWLNLNGLWDYSIIPKRQLVSENYEGQILVPFAIESALSGVMRRLSPSQRLCYRRSFKIPTDWKKIKGRILLHFGAVDWQTVVFVNGHEVGSHTGGYLPFTFDVTDYLILDKANELVVSVWDPTDHGCQERGKQVLRPFGVNYTAISGIWQTVWLEPVPHSYIDRLQISTDIDSSMISIHPKIQNLDSTLQIQIDVKIGSTVIVSYFGPIHLHIDLKIPKVQLWSPETPFLYDLQISLLHHTQVVDTVSSYFGMRKIEIARDSAGIIRLCLNHKPIFQYGPLDQGYWPDGLYTAPTDDALKFDILAAQARGFNMIRKHIKVEPARWYYYCDKLGMLVWQDMPSGGSQAAGALTNFVFHQKIVLEWGRKKASVQNQYFAELSEMIQSLYHFQCIVMWVPFNEGWGQFQTEKAVSLIKSLDSSRLINNASGWKDHKVGDILDVHQYPGPGMPSLDPNRAVVCGEFGGLGYEVPNHLWKIKFKWGYKKFNSKEALQEKYASLISHLLELKGKGLSAGVYTQITDVEGEINGLITYDREIAKLDSDWLRQLHRSLYS